MSSIYRIVFNRNVTSYFFYNEILSQLHDYFNNNKEKKLLLDFSEVNYIDAIVVPNILVVGQVLKDYFLYPVELYIPWKPDLLSYLTDIGFIYYIKKYQLFQIDEKYIGGYEYGRLSKQCKTYCFEYENDMFNIRNSLRDSIEVIRYIHSGTKNIFEKTIDDTLYLLSEICLNGCTHSKSKCFAVFQSITGKNVDYKKACMSISDYGIGFYGSFVEKIKNQDIDKLHFTTASEFLSLGEEKSLVAILEGIFYRSDKTNYGIFDVAREILKADGIMRIHSEDTQLIITKNSFYNYLTDINYGKDKLVQEFKKVINGNNDNRFSIVRKTESKLKGVHIEIEIPLYDR